MTENISILVNLCGDLDKEDSQVIDNVACRCPCSCKEKNYCSLNESYFEDISHTRILFREFNRIFEKLIIEEENNLEIIKSELEEKKRNLDIEISEILQKEKQDEIKLTEADKKQYQDDLDEKLKLQTKYEDELKKNVKIFLYENFIKKYIKKYCNELEKFKKELSEKNSEIFKFAEKLNKKYFLKEIEEKYVENTLENLLNNYVICYIEHKQNKKGLNTIKNNIGLCKNYFLTYFEEFENFRRQYMSNNSTPKIFIHEKTVNNKKEYFIEKNYQKQEF